MSNQGPYGPPPGQYPPPPQQYPYPGPPPQQQPYPGPQQPYGPQYGPPPGPPNWGPPPGPGFGFSPQPPKKKRSKAPFIVVPLVLLFGAVGLFVVSSILKHNGDDTYTQPEPTTSSAYPTEPATTSAPATTHPTQPARTTTTTTQPSATRTTVAPPSDNVMVTKNRVYKSGVMKSVSCREPGYRPTSLTNARKYYAAVLVCLNRAWPRQVQYAGGRFRPPSLMIFAGSATSPCGGGSGAGISFYCPTNQTIYMEAGTDVTFWGKNGNISYQSDWVRMKMADTVAHEFGHHVQNMVGILTASWNLRYASSNTKALEISRRTELQASCFGNVFLGANRSTFGITGDKKYQLQWLHSHQGDEYGVQPDHGSRAVYPLWTNAGWTSRSPASCNTFVAPASYVR
ncbi:neutral zinc metallopeptidase [Kribbella sp. GL6]|uniref:neutral zinc metallopeptidase n=1 Tax=Kribbella sp. GL6 TaxID=3419765 RepID=UPI003D0253AA